MMYKTSDIFNSKNIKRSIHQQNSSFSSPYQSKHPKQQDEKEEIRIFTVKYTDEIQKQKVYFRSNLNISYTPQFSILSDVNMAITIKIKDYSLELLPWLIKKDALFKINIVLGIYLAFLQLVDIYGLFPLHPNLMRVNQKQQVAVWINKNYQAMQPDQILTKNTFSIKQFIKSFLKIFYCCLPNKKISQMYNDPKQLLTDLAKIKRKQQMHKNCHQFLKQDNKITNSKKTNKCNSTLFIQPKNSLSEYENHKKNQSIRYSTKPITRYSNSPRKNANRLSSFSPVRRQEKSTSLQKRFSKTGLFMKNQKNKTVNVPHFLKKKSQQSICTLPNKNNKNNPRNERLSTNQMCLSSTGELFKRYLMYNTSKFQKMSQHNFSHSMPLIEYHSSGSQRTFIFQSDVHKLGDNISSMTIMEEPFVSQNLKNKQRKGQSQFSQSINFFNPLKFRKMSSNTNQKKKQEQKTKKTFIKSGNWPRRNYNQQQNFTFTNQRDDSPKNEGRQKLKNSFPYKTSSTLTSFRLSNQHQLSIIPSKSQQNLSNCLNQIQIPFLIKQKDKKIQQMKIQQQNQLESDFNNIFSMQNSIRINQENQKRLQKIMNEFQQVLF